MLAQSRAVGARRGLRWEARAGERVFPAYVRHTTRLSARDARSRRTNFLKISYTSLLPVQLLLEVLERGVHLLHVRAPRRREVLLGRLRVGPEGAQVRGGGELLCE